MKKLTFRWSVLFRSVSVGAVVAVAVCNFRLHEFAFFWLDDFNNIVIVNRLGLRVLLEGVLHPSSGPNAFRPLGMIFYWSSWRLFGLHAPGYHWVAWFLYVVTLLFVYVMLRRLTNSNIGAATGSLLYAIQPVFAHIYWSFGAIFEVLSGVFYFAGLVLWTKVGRSRGRTFLAYVAFLVALQAKEMPITLPIMWFIWDVFVRPRKVGILDQIRVILPSYVVPLFIVVWYTSFKLMTKEPMSVDAPYYMEFSVRSATQSFLWYANTLAGATWPVGVWLVIVAVLVLLSFKSRRIAFLFAYAVISLLPVLFLVNHRFDFYWYVPFFGVAGLAGLAVASVLQKLPRPMKRIPTIVLQIAVFLIAARQYYFHHKTAMIPGRLFEEGLSRQYARLLYGVSALPKPARGATVQYLAAGNADFPLPDYFDEDLLTSATNVAFEMTTLNAVRGPLKVSGDRYLIYYDGTAFRRLLPNQMQMPPRAP